MTDTAAKAPNREPAGPPAGQTGQTGQVGQVGQAGQAGTTGQAPTTQTGPTGATAGSAPPGTGFGRLRGNRVEPGGGTPLITEMGKTHIADGVVAKVASFAAREIPGVHSLGAGMARRMGQLRSLVPGAPEASRQGVAVEVGEREAAIDLDLVTYYGHSIADVSEAVRRNVVDRVQAMTSLRVVEVNINVDDVFVEGEQPDGQEGGEAQPESRVQ
jgi:uncharacterized alkaline shock family protein YloU